ncbi:MAG: hypothetical protein GXO63_01995 [Candidatus Micrarchaeota archaeon]|nr:hypothetical protein [Candidatus Micrarchaeota archaeon]
MNASELKEIYANSLKLTSFFAGFLGGLVGITDPTIPVLGSASLALLKERKFYVPVALYAAGLVMGKSFMLLAENLYKQAPI